MSNELESEMKMEEIDQLFNKNKTKKIVIILSVLTLLIFVIGGMSKKGNPIPVAVAATDAIADTVSTGFLSEGLGVAMNNVDNLLRDFV